MKSKRILLGVLAAALILPTLQSCKKGENDPGISFRSRKGRLAGDWTVNSSSFTMDVTDVSMDKDANTNTGGGTDTDDMDYTSSMSVTFDGASETTTMSSTSDNAYTQAYTGGSNTDTELVVREESYDGAAGTYEWTETTTNSCTGCTSTTTTEKENGDFTNTISIAYSFAKDGTFTMTKTSSETESKKGSSTNGIADIYTTTYKSETVTETTETVEGTWSFVGKNKGEEFKKNERVALWHKSSTVETTQKSTYNGGYTGAVDYVSTYTETNTDTYTDNVPDEVWTLDMLKNKEMSAMVEMTSTNDYVTNSVSTSNGISTGYVYDNTGTRTVTGSGSMTLSQE